MNWHIYKAKKRRDIFFSSFKSVWSIQSFFHRFWLSSSFFFQTLEFFSKLKDIFLISSKFQAYFSELKTSPNPFVGDAQLSVSEKKPGLLALQVPSY